MLQIKIAFIGTFVFINIVLVLFLWERNRVPIDHEIPSIAEATSKTMTSEIILEKVNSSKQGDYIVEDYKEIEVWYDHNGNEVKRQPTGEHTYMRYWDSDKPKIIMDR
jgi:hypothetical protein